MLLTQFSSRASRPCSLKQSICVPVRLAKASPPLLISSHLRPSLVSLASCPDQQQQCHPWKEGFTARSKLITQARGKDTPEPDGQRSEGWYQRAKRVVEARDAVKNGTFTPEDLILLAKLKKGELEKISDSFEHHEAGCCKGGETTQRKRRELEEKKLSGTASEDEKAKLSKMLGGRPSSREDPWKDITYNKERNVFRTNLRNIKINGVEVKVPSKSFRVSKYGSMEAAATMAALYVDFIRRDRAKECKYPEEASKLLSKTNYERIIMSGECPEPFLQLYKDLKIAVEDEFNKSQGGGHPSSRDDPYSYLSYDGNTFRTNLRSIKIDGVKVKVPSKSFRVSEYGSMEAAATMAALWVDSILRDLAKKYPEEASKLLSKTNYERIIKSGKCPEPYLQLWKDRGGKLPP